MPNSRRTRIRRWVYAHLPAWLKSRDFEIFAAVLCIVAGLPLLFGEVDAPSLEAQLPSVIVQGWAINLIVGGFLTIVGVVKTESRRTKAEDLLIWRRVEAYGLTMLAYAAYVYAFILLMVNWHQAWSASMITLIFALTCHSREVAVQLEIIEYRIRLGLPYVVD